MQNTSNAPISRKYNCYPAEILIVITFHPQFIVIWNTWKPANPIEQEFHLLKLSKSRFVYFTFAHCRVGVISLSNSSSSGRPSIFSSCACIRYPFLIFNKWPASITLIWCLIILFSDFCLFHFWAFVTLPYFKCEFGIALCAGGKVKNPHFFRIFFFGQFYNFCFLHFNIQKPLSFWNL